MSLHFRVLIALALLGMCFAASMRQTRSVSSAEQTTIVNLHNTHRSAVTPTASDMRKMYWNDALAMSAQNWIDQCLDGHDSNFFRSNLTQLGTSVGQNAAHGHTSWTAVVNSWHSEVQYYDYATNSKVPSTPVGKAIGHYTQVVWAKTSLVGCAMKVCSDGNRYACNYAVAGNMRSQGVPEWPYVSGASCASCGGANGDKCVNNLCDCANGLLCRNGGTINIATCACSCKYGWSGDSCETCAAADFWWCNGFFTEPDCPEYSNAPQACPRMCKTGQCEPVTK